MSRPSAAPLLAWLRPRGAVKHIAGSGFNLALLPGRFRGSLSGGGNRAKDTLASDTSESDRNSKSVSENFVW
ncbi:MAG: hypothetical protein JO334_08225 [Verrucomicrobia bacterium]|nr:hypothetical protein [Verrucomicrobiota bacterium]